MEIYTVYHSDTVTTLHMYSIKNTTNIGINHFRLQETADAAKKV